MDGRRHRLRLSIPLAFVLAAPRRAAGDEPLLREAFAPLEVAARDFAAAGRVEELNELLLLLRAAGRDGAACDTLATPLRAQAAKVKHATAPPAGTGKSLAKLAGDLGKGLEQRPDVSRAAVARFVLALDGENAAAHAALGFERVGTEWLDAAGKKRAQRREAIAAALVRARSLDNERARRDRTEPRTGEFGARRVDATFAQVALCPGDAPTSIRVVSATGQVHVHPSSQSVNRLAPRAGRKCERLSVRVCLWVSEQGSNRKGPRGLESRAWASE